ncbi:MAG: carbohydrate-binding domain-containing protein, partial [Candidatus Methanomethylophilaceae archaeon]|nr:carbohydrate-binding domain-containing protein [Candidatus Methanomethylophilaceae archaeon]
MDAKIIGIIAIAALVAIGGAAFALAGPSSDNDDSVSGGSAESRTMDTTIDTGEETITDNTPETQSGEYPFTIVSESGTCECEITETSEGYTITFSEINEEGTTYSISGTLNGNIVIEAGDYDFELVLNGITITTSSEVPIYIGSGEDVTITAKKNTVNTIYDNRSEVSDDDI